jgi:hypothetical protein
LDRWKPQAPSATTATLSSSSRSDEYSEVRSGCGSTHEKDVAYALVPRTERMETGPDNQLVRNCLCGCSVARECSAQDRESLQKTPRPSAHALGRGALPGFRPGRQSSFHAGFERDVRRPRRGPRGHWPRNSRTRSCCGRYLPARFLLREGQQLLHDLGLLPLFCALRLVCRPCHQQHKRGDRHNSVRNHS